MKKTIAIDDVKIGMYLSQISESESKLSVKSQGIIKSTGTIESLKKRGVISIEIDMNKSVHLAASNINEQGPQPSDNESKQADNNPQSSEKATFVALNIEEQREHLAIADKLYTQARGVQSRFIEQLRSGDSPDFDALNHTCQDIIDGIFENKEALSCLLMLIESGDYLAEHSLNCAILMGMFAKHRGYSQATIEDLTLSGLLMDIGMTLLPQDLGKRDDTFSAADFALMKTHGDIGFELIERYADLPPLVGEIVLNHHERIDGSGYPKQKRGDEVSEFVQMASIVDCFDAMITNRNYKSSKGCQEVLEILLKDAAFDSALVESFVDAVGLFPLGSLVHLKKHRVHLG